LLFSNLFCRSLTLVLLSRYRVTVGVNGLFFCSRSDASVGIAGTTGIGSFKT
ncbi:hypothetical protein A2U01_0087546, partial [Trifolium medium]|nr:hypothetical protein [Trifolium medium]